MGKIAMLHEEPPATAIKRIIGDIDGYEVGPRQILGAIYLRPEKTVGGIVLSQRNLDEDFYQSKVVLALKVGDGTTFAGKQVIEGDWLVVRPSDCWSLEVNGVRCRHFFDSEIRARVTDAFPELIVW